MRASKKDIKYFKGVLVQEVQTELRKNKTYLSDDQNELGIDSLIKIELLERIDTNSSPSWVLSLLEEYKDVYGVNPEDRLWMIIDRDIHNNSEMAINQVINDCKKNGFKIAITNPCFELWLLLHCIKSFDTYDKNTLLENPKKRIKSRKRYIEELLM